MNEYQDIILDHYRDPLNYGALAGATHSAQLRNLSCGDAVTVYLRVADEKIKSVSFEGSGCAISTAATSMLTEHIKGKGVKEVLLFSRDDLLALLGVEISAARLKCALIGLEAVHNALQDG